MTIPPVIGQPLYCALDNHKVLMVTVFASMRMVEGYDLLTTRIHFDETPTLSDIEHHNAHFIRLLYINGECQNNQIFTDRETALTFALKRAQREADYLTTKLSHTTQSIANLKAVIAKLDVEKSTR